MACDYCGKKKGHMSGCNSPDNAPRGRRSRGGNPTPADKTHNHDYTIKSTRVVKTATEIIEYQFLECLNKKGCPQPDNIRIITTKR